MATGGQKERAWNLVKVGDLTLKNTDKYPSYISIVICQDKMVVLDSNNYKVDIYGLHDGKFIAWSGRLKSLPCDMCLMDAMTICVLHRDGQIKIMSIESTDRSCDIKTIRTFHLQGVLMDSYHGVVRFKDGLVVTGVRQGVFYWCIVSMDDGHVDAIHQICKGKGRCRVTTKDTMIYISCEAGSKSPNTGVYAVDILNSRKCKYQYKHPRLQSPTSIVINEDWNIFVCNTRYPDSSIHQLTDSCQPVAIFTRGIPWDLIALFWDNGRLYGICWMRPDITVFRSVYRGSPKASEILASSERKQPVIEETAIPIVQGNVSVDQGKSSVATEMSPSGPVPDDSEDVKQGSPKASEILVSNERKQPVIEETAIPIGQGNVPGESTARANWGSKIEFILTIIGFTVGLGTVWRFPYLCFRNGGGAFLVPYFLSLFVMVIPLYYMELSFGQFASLGPIKIWIINPAFKGLGIGMVIFTCLFSFYYNVIIAVCIHYFFASMASEVPWSKCNREWVSCNCRDSTMNASDPDPWNKTWEKCVNFTFNVNATKDPSEEYFLNRVLRQSPKFSEAGDINWELALCLLLTWLVVFLVLTKGIKSLGKNSVQIVYVTSICPYVLLTALLIRGCTLDGYYNGIQFYLQPNMSKLAEAEIWSDAAVQIFYSLGIGSGGLIAMASYNNFKNNCLRYAFLVPVLSCATSFYAGFVIFSCLGYMAHQKGVGVADVAAGGPGLAFIAYPEALRQMPVAPLWSVLFFLMMLMMGFNYSCSSVESVLTGIIDESRFLSTSKWGCVAFRAAACTFGFLMGLPMTLQSGFHLLEVVDNYVGGFPLLFIGLFETIVIIFIYGFFTFKKDLEMMLGRKLITNISFFYFGVMWCFVTPVCILAVIVFNVLQYEPYYVTNGAVFDKWADVIGWMIVAATLLPIPVWFFGYYFVMGGYKLCVDVNSAQPKWGPSLEENKDGYRYPKDDRQMTMPEVDGVGDSNVGYFTSADENRAPINGIS